MKNQPITRRDSLKKIIHLSGGILVAGNLPLSITTKMVTAAETLDKWIVEGIGQQSGYSVKQLTRNVFETAGGMNRFISRGDVVVIKPNISWARAPQLAATTNPEVLEAVIELCQEAGAKKVRIADHTIHDAQRCFAVTGAGQVAQKTGAELIHPRSSMMKKMNLHGNRLDVWPVFTPLVEADKVINLPVAKVHGLSGLTLGMKNWIGAVGGRRSALHQDIHLTIVDLAQFFKPHITLIDATRIMISNGPSGGSPSDVKVVNRLILSNDPVAADAKGALLFDKKPEDIGFIHLGDKWGLGTMDPAQLKQYSVVL
ncbi:MAG: DUF362 domain-containing protein [Desulfobacteraceae bacterium]|nr:DUF362 domain-containing protein [Desulfobacteraceae bacterium]MBC2756300.1 DUF362 domain-containing protein [Desulfobacteraceae bacterium]